MAGITHSSLISQGTAGGKQTVGLETSCLHGVGAGGHGLHSSAHQTQMTQKAGLVCGSYGAIPPPFLRVITRGIPSGPGTVFHVPTNAL